MAVIDDSNIVKMFDNRNMMVIENASNPTSGYNTATTSVHLQQNNSNQVIVYSQDDEGQRTENTLNRVVLLNGNSTDRS